MNKRTTGFTLMETTLALTLLTVGMLSLAGVFSQTVKSNTTVRRKQTAVLLATAKLTELCSLPLSEINQLKGTFDKPFNDYAWQAKLGHLSDNKQITDVWLQVRHKSDTGIKLWTQMAGGNAQ